MNKIWLASYPKSGNTWFRLLIANLRRDSPVDINDLPHSGGMASARARFDTVMMFPSGLLTHAECDRSRPDYYRWTASMHRDEGPDDRQDTAIDNVQFSKVHDAYTQTSLGEPLLGGPSAASGAILIVRDPRDVASSLANHGGWSIDDAIDFMASPDSGFCNRTDRQPNQLRQQLGGWSRYHAGWLTQGDLPVHRVRYEDLQEDTAATLRGALEFAGVTVTASEIARAVDFAAFDELRGQEDRSGGFREAPRPHGAASFFRRGVAGGWHDELTRAQRERIELDHGGMMAGLGYTW